MHRLQALLTLLGPVVFQGAPAANMAPVLRVRAG